MGEEVDPAAEFLAREQSVLADLDDNYKDQKGRFAFVVLCTPDVCSKSIPLSTIDVSHRELT